MKQFVGQWSKTKRQEPKDKQIPRKMTKKWENTKQQIRNTK